MISISLLGSHCPAAHCRFPADYMMSWKHHSALLTHSLSPLTFPSFVFCFYFSKQQSLLMFIIALIKTIFVLFFWSCPFQSHHPFKVEFLVVMEQLLVGWTGDILLFRQVSTLWRSGSPQGLRVCRKFTPCEGSHDSTNWFYGGTSLWSPNSWASQARASFNTNKNEKSSFHPVQVYFISEDTEIHNKQFYYWLSLGWNWSLMMRGPLPFPGMPFNRCGWVFREILQKEKTLRPLHAISNQEIHTELTFVLCGFPICRITYSLKWICNPQCALCLCGHLHTCTDRATNIERPAVWFPTEGNFSSQAANKWFFFFPRSV